MPLSISGGFNEHYFFWPGARERLERPLSNFIDVNPFVADENFGDAAIGWVMGRLAGWLALNPVLGHSHAAYLVIRGIEAAGQGQGLFKSNKKTTLTGIFKMPEDIRRDAEREFAVQIGLYQKYLRATEALARDYNLKSAYFIQPAPAYGKVLTTRKSASPATWPTAPIYRKMVAGLMTLRERKLAMYDLGDIFRARPK